MTRPPDDIYRVLARRDRQRGTEVPVVRIPPWAIDALGSPQRLAISTNGTLALTPAGKVNRGRTVRVRRRNMQVGGAWLVALGFTLGEGAKIEVSGASITVTPKSLAKSAA